MRVAIGTTATRNPWRRDHRISSRFTTGEFADLALVAAAWDITPASVVWAVMATWLSHHRDRDVMKLPYNNISRVILMKGRDLEHKYAEQRESPEGVTRDDDGARCSLCGHDLDDTAEDRGGGDGGPAEPRDPSSFELRRSCD